MDWLAKTGVEQAVHKTKPLQQQAKKTKAHEIGNNTYGTPSTWDRHLFLGECGFDGKTVLLMRLFVSFQRFYTWNQIRGALKVI